MTLWQRLHDWWQPPPPPPSDRAVIWLMDTNERHRQHSFFPVDGKCPRVIEWQGRRYVQARQVGLRHLYRAE